MNTRTHRSRVIDLNADIGEAVDQRQRDIEEALMRVVTSVNIACGGHSGDEATMRAAIDLAKANNCAIGAHPSYPDVAGFGRRRVEMCSDELEQSIAAQIAQLGRLATDAGASLTHVKPHGALYQAASASEEVARAILDASRAWNSRIRLVAAVGSQALEWWAAQGAKVCAEGFVDRVYEPDGCLRERALPNALITSPTIAAKQAVDIATLGRAHASDGSETPVVAQTLCVHADTPGAAEIAQRVEKELLAAGVSLRAP